ncbi:ABC transporter substrate-binding protein [Sutcliffiella cohnii]|uniref:ABC transporter substrate-binding protein n=1 Tax=Sutcliffiella cohnii TaxID=33932 RepID=UPI002E216A9D|nr:ABC transporter substrate-binding protein [Sutcliffiella cohnii]
MKKVFVFPALVLLVIFSLIACSNSTTSNGTSEIIVGTGADPTSLDPRKTWSGPGYSMNAHMFEPLVFRKIDNGQVTIEGVLAESYENVDELTWKFTLRKGVTFHNGVPLTGEAVKFTIESILDPEFNTPLVTWLRDVEEVTTEGDLVVYIKTKTPTRGLITSLAQVPIVEPGAVKELGAEFNVKPVGTGPYKIVEYVANNNVVMERYDGYWGEPGVNDRLQFRIMPENSVRLAALQSGDVHIAENISADQIETVRNNPDLDVHITETLRVNMYVLNFENPWISKPEFRQALSLAINRDSLVNNILSGNTIPASSVSPPGTIGFNKDLPVYPYDVEEAKRLLAEIGYDGTPIKMGGPVGRYAMDRQINEAVAGMFKQAGINVELETLEFSSYIPKYNENFYDIAYIGITDFTINPNTHWDGYYYSESSQGGYANAEVDALMDQAIQTLDNGEVAEIYKKVQEILYKDLPTLPLYYEPHMVGVRKGITGFSPRLDEYIIVRDTKFEKK